MYSEWKLLFDKHKSEQNFVDDLVLIKECCECEIEIKKNENARNFIMNQIQNYAIEKCNDDKIKKEIFELANKTNNGINDYESCDYHVCTSNSLIIEHNGNEYMIEVWYNGDNEGSGDGGIYIVGEKEIDSPMNCMIYLCKCLELKYITPFRLWHIIDNILCKKFEMCEVINLCFSFKYYCEHIHKQKIINKIRHLFTNEKIFKNLCDILFVKCCNNNFIEDECLDRTIEYIENKIKIFEIKFKNSCSMITFLCENDVIFYTIESITTKKQPKKQTKSILFDEKTNEYNCEWLHNFDIIMTDENAKEMSMIIHNSFN